MDTVIAKFKNEDYIYVNEIIRDLRYLINYYNMFADVSTAIIFIQVGKQDELVTFV